MKENSKGMNKESVCKEKSKEEEKKRNPELCPVGSSDGSYQAEEAKVSEEKQKGAHHQR